MPERALLLGIAEVHDLSLAHQVGPLATLLADEQEVVADLSRARPWLEALDTPQGVLDALLEQEWSGFVARLGQVGPWVFAASVAGLQALRARYADVVTQAGRSRLEGALPASLLGRLRATGVHGTAQDLEHALRAEEAFWIQAQAQARQTREAWTFRRDRDRI